jgi:hypothetical protein
MRLRRFVRLGSESEARKEYAIRLVRRAQTLPQIRLFCQGRCVRSNSGRRRHDRAKIVAAVTAADLSSKVNASPDEHVRNYFDIPQKMNQRRRATAMIEHTQELSAVWFAKKFELRASQGAPIPIPCRTSSR